MSTLGLARHVTAVTATLLLFVSEGSAGESSTLPLGSRIRVHFTEASGHGDRSQRLSGKLVGLDDVTLRLESTSSLSAPDTVALAREGITRLDLSIREGKRIQGAALGFGLGLATGMVAGLSDGDDKGGLVSFSAEQKGLMLGLPLGLLGLILGAAVAPGQEWLSIEPAGARLSHGPAGGGRPGASVAMRF